MLVKGEEIVCSKGHKLGSVTEGITDGQPITAHELRIDFSVAEILDDGHSCRACHERITQVRNGVYRVKTARGWVGDNQGN